MCFNNKKKKQRQIKKFRLSENAISFIKNYALVQLNINTKIDTETLDRIVDLAVEWELDMIDPLSKDGCDKTYEYPERARNELADMFVGEITGQWNDDEAIPDFDDINNRLGLI